MGLRELKEKAKTLSGKISDALEASAAGKPRRLFFLFGGMAVFFLILLIAALAVNFRRPEESAPAAISLEQPILPEELFIPDEPDFVPEFLLEREARLSWSMDDIRVYWRRPENPAFWQDVLRAAVDELMESVP